jgi:Icc-related predicted phosphoesterase
MKLNAEFVCHPTVFAINDEYQIVLPVKSEMLFWIRVNDKDYFDHSCGILRSSTLIHKVTVPMKELNRAKKYTVCYRKIIDRKPYFPENEELVEETYKFRPIKRNKPLNIYHISDTHGRVDESSHSAKFASGNDLDLLILNGDIADHSGGVENISMIYKIASNITEGSLPCVFSRGNHDMRGAFAEHLAEYTPTDKGVTYFTFRLGDLWGLVLDCAEDKGDHHIEYGGTICCHPYRLEETRFLKEVAKKKKYDARGVKYKMVIVHAPFTCKNLEDNGIFDIENELYSEWVNILNKQIKPDLLLAGHFHQCRVVFPGEPMDDRGQTFPVIIGAKPKTLDDENGFTGTLLHFESNEISVSFADNTENIMLSKHIKIKDR